MNLKRKAKESKTSKEDSIPFTQEHIDALNTISELLQCCKCKKLLEQPYHLNCDHCLCKKCFDALPKKNPKCPLCKASIDIKAIRHDPIISNLVTKFDDINIVNKTSSLTPKHKQKNNETEKVVNPPISVYGLKNELKTQSPISSPKKMQLVDIPSKRIKKESPSKLMALGSGRSLEIVSDSSNDAYTYLYSHPPYDQKSSMTPIEEKTTSSNPVRKTKRSVSTKSSNDEFDLSDYIIITSSLSTRALDKIRQFSSQYHTIWMQEFPQQSNQVDASYKLNTSSLDIKEDVIKTKKTKRGQQKYIVVIRSKEGWCKRTVKYLYGLAYGAWIVSMDWIEVNLTSDHLIPPTKYEIKGDLKTHVQNAPKMARIAHEKGQPGIFNGIFFFIRVQDTKDGIPLNILVDLMQRCGCVRDLEDMNSRGKSMRLMEVVDRLTSKSGLDVVTVDWVLNCIGSWKLL